MKLLLLFTLLSLHLTLSSSTDQNSVDFSHKVVSRCRDVMNTIFKNKRREFKNKNETLWVGNAFESWPTSNPYHDVTSGHVVLVIKNDYVSELHTPFGLIRLIGGGLVSTMILISNEFLDQMTWSLSKYNEFMDKYHNEYQYFIVESIKNDSDDEILYSPVKCDKPEYVCPNWDYMRELKCHMECIININTHQYSFYSMY